VFGLRINVITSVVVFLGAVIYLQLARRGREDPALLGGPAPAEAPSSPTRSSG